MTNFSLNQNSSAAMWLNAIVESNIDACICTDQDLKILSFNRSAERILGFSASEVLNHNIADFWPNQGQLDQLKEAINDNFAEVLPLSSRVRHETGYRRDGTKFPMEIAVTAMSVDESCVALINIRDRSEFQNLTHSAKRTKAFHASLMQSSLNARLVIDEQGVVIECNEAFENILGYDQNEIIGQKMDEHIIPEADRENHRRGMQKFLKTGNGPVIGKRIEVNALHKQGYEFPVELTVSNVVVDNQNYFSAEIRDITDRVKATSELQEARLQAEASNKAKSKFLATMSHEIRTPLTAIIGILSLIKIGNRDEALAQLITTAEASGKNLLEIINDVLDYSKLEAGKMLVKNEPFNITNCVEEVAALYAPEAHAKGLEIALYIDPQIPFEIIGDGAKIALILRNLVSNAIKFSERGHVCISLKVHEDSLSLEVEDTGIGMTAADTENVMHSFVQADNTDSRKYGGTGLGLAICKQLLTLMNGEIEIRSCLTKGSLFIAHFPLCVASTERQETLALRSKVYIVAADSFEADTVGRQLAALGCQVNRLISLDEVPAKNAVQAESGTTLIVFDNTDINPSTDRWTALEELEGFEHKYFLTRQPLETLSSTIKILQSPLVYSQLLSIFQRQPTMHPPSDTIDQQTITSIGRGINLLLVEDSKSNQMVIGSMLEAAGYNIDIVNNGSEAYAAVMALPYDIVLMDVQMPEMNGFQATELIRQIDGQGSEVAIIALTAKAFPEDIEECLDRGMNDYISKPVEIETLLATLRKWTPGKFKIETNGKTICDMAVISKLRKAVGSGKIIPMLEAFKIELEDRTQLLIQGMDEDDWEKVRDECHTIKGLSAAFGFNELSKEAKTVESHCTEHEQIPKESAFTLLQDIIIVSSRHLKKLISLQAIDD